MKLWLTQECGQKWWRKSSWWRTYKTAPEINLRPELRWLYEYRHEYAEGSMVIHWQSEPIRKIGVAFGPIMFFWRGLA